MLTRMDHLRAVLQGDLDNLVASEISADRGVLAALANDVGLVGLCSAAKTRRLSAPNVHNYGQLKEGGIIRVVLCRCMLRRSS